MDDWQAGPCMGRCMGRCICVLPGLVRLNLSIGGGLDSGGDGGEVVGVVSCEIKNNILNLRVCVYLKECVYLKGLP